MRRYLLIAVLCLLSAEAVAQNERAPETPALAVELIAAGGAGGQIYVQQQVLLKVTLISRYPFKTLQIDTPGIEDAEIHVASRARTREFSTYGGSGWRHERISALFPLRSGAWNIPAITASGSVVRPDGVTLDFATSSQASLVDVRPAHPHLNGFWWVAAHDIRLSDEWSRDIATVRIGDTVRRTVLMKATGTTADRLPELVQNVTPGAVFTDAGETRTTRFTPEGAVAEVSRSWDITITADNPVNIAPVSITWWHAGESRPANAGVPAIRIEPLAVDADQLRADLLAEAAARKDSSALMLLVLAALLAIPLLVFAVTLLMTVLPTRADLRLRDGLRRDSFQQQAEALVDWGRTAIDPTVSTLQGLAVSAPPTVARALQGLESATYGQNPQRKRPGARVFMRWSRQQRITRLKQKTGTWVSDVID